MEKIKSRFILALLATFTLGLAPFNPPHIWEKLTRIFKGGSGNFKPIDWFDVLLHGSPWVLLLVFTIQLIKAKKAN